MWTDLAEQVLETSVQGVTCQSLSGPVLTGIMSKLHEAVVWSPLLAGLSLCTYPMWKALTCFLFFFLIECPIPFPFPPFLHKWLYPLPCWQRSPWEGHNAWSVARRELEVGQALNTHLPTSCPSLSSHNERRRTEQTQCPQHGWGPPA